MRYKPPTIDIDKLVQPPTHDFDKLMVPALKLSALCFVIGGIASFGFYAYFAVTAYQAILTFASAEISWFGITMLFAAYMCARLFRAFAATTYAVLVVACLREGVDYTITQEDLKDPEVLFTRMRRFYADQFDKIREESWRR